VAQHHLYRDSVTVHPTAVVSDDVELGSRVAIGPHAVVLGPCRIGDDVQIGPGCVIGTPPELTSARQNLAWAGDPAHHGVEIGAGTVVRELTTVQQGALATTRIGAGCWLLSRTYVAHDCVLDDGVTTSAGVAMAGYVRIGYGANLGMNATVHQRRVVGPGAMVGMSAAVTRDLPPFAKAYGTPARVRGANTIGAVRRGVAQAAADQLDAAYRAGEQPDLTASADPELAAAGKWWAHVGG
jgi:UDP-N-acetylglucosamine acyltransferase